MSTADIIIAIVVINFCAAITSGTVVYYLLRKKIKEESDCLFHMIWDDRQSLQHFYEKFEEHMCKYHR